MQTHISKKLNGSHAQKHEENKTKMTTRHILVKLPKVSDKDTILKAAREQVIDRGTQTSRHNSSLENRRVSLKYGGGGKNLSRNLYLAKLLSKNESKIKTFPDTARLKDFITSRACTARINKGPQAKETDRDESGSVQRNEEHQKE